jgi:hypothetical protein
LSKTYKGRRGRLFFIDVGKALDHAEAEGQEVISIFPSTISFVSAKLLLK